MFLVCCFFKYFLETLSSVLVKTFNLLYSWVKILDSVCSVYFSFMESVKPKFLHAFVRVVRNIRDTLAQQPE